MKNTMKQYIEELMRIYELLFKGYIDQGLERMQEIDQEVGFPLSKKAYRVFSRPGVYNSIDEEWSLTIDDIQKEIMMEKYIKVKGSTPVKYLAGSILKEIEANGVAKVRTIGAASLSQLVKAIIVANTMIVARRNPLSINFYFQEVTIDNKTVTAIVTVLK